MGVFIPLLHIPTPCNKNKDVLFLLGSYTSNENHQNVESFSFFDLGAPLSFTFVIYNHPSSSCNNTIILHLKLHVLSHIKSFMRNADRIIGGVSWHLDMKIVAFTELFFYPISFPFANSSSFLPHRHSSDARHLPPKFL